MRVVKNNLKGFGDIFSKSFFIDENIMGLKLSAADGNSFPQHNAGFLNTYTKMKPTAQGDNRLFGYVF
jgi:hypothetical protein